MIRSPLAIFLTLGALAASASVAAQDSIYRGVDAKGQTVYSNSSKGLSGARKIQLPEPVLTGVEPPQGVQAPTSPTSRLPISNAAASGGVSRFEQAQDRLREAQNIFDVGDEPAPGERLGTATGGSRLAPGYYERREREAKALAEARAAAFEAGSR